MFRNYLKTAFRSLLRFKVYSFINIGGLAVGMAACIMIFLYVENDFSFDEFNKNYNRIYRVVSESKENDKDVTWSITPTGYANAFQNDFPGIVSARLSHPALYAPVIKYGDRLFTAKNFIFADSTFFDVLTFPLLEGNPKTALTEPFSMVLTKSEAQKIFGTVDPVGQTIRVSNLFDFKVTGVAKDPPANSSVQFNYLVSLVNLVDVYKTQFHLDQPNILNYFRGGSSFYTFLLLPDHLDVQTVLNQLPSFVDKYLGEGSSKETKLLLQPLSDIHFNTNYLWDFQNKGDIRYDYILSAIAFFILLIACVNFISISTARSATRAKEVGMRKVLGANRSRIASQLILEFALLVAISAILAVALVELLLPIFNSLSGKQLSLNFFAAPWITVSFSTVLLSVIFLACAYPSIYLSSLQPAIVIKGIFESGGTKSSVTRKSLIAFQFAISIFLIVVSVITWSQYYFLKTHKLGFDAQQVIYMPFNAELQKSYNAFKTKLTQDPDIQSVSIANWIPGDAKDVEGYSWHEKTETQYGTFFSLIVDPDYTKTLGLKFAAGRNFSWQLQSDWKNSFIVNETAAKMMGWSPTEAIGKLLWHLNHHGQIIGVVKDFNFRSLHHGIEPVVMLMDSTGPYFETLIKTSSHNIPATIGYVEKTWKRFSPDFPFEYHFLDQSFGQLYESEQRLGEIFGAFSVLAILIACLGLFGLASYATQRRTKEIGVRKVLGASVMQIVKLVARDFVILVVIANVIAWPIAYYAMERWLQNFSYRTTISLWIFILSGILTLVIALATVSFHAIRAATVNPSVSLRCE